MSDPRPITPTPERGRSSSWQDLEERSNLRVDPVSESKTANLAGVVHELSNALTVVLGWLDTALERPLDEKVHEAVATALTHARHGYRVARQAIGARVEMQAQALGLQETLEGAVRAIIPQARQRSVELGIRPPFSQLPEGQPEMVREPEALSQILVNLLLNAVAFSPKKGTVTVEWQVRSGWAVIDVVDQGPGIDEARAPALLDAPDSTRRGGAGIGLSYSATLARRHGATLSLKRSSPGATFELVWPLLESQSAADATLAEVPRATSLASRTPAITGLRVLLLEDDEAICGLLELALTSRGASVDRAGSLERAVALIEEKTFDIALVDLSPISHSTGEALRALRKGQFPLVLITGSASPIQEEEERAFSAWVRKPFETPELLDVIVRVSGRA